MAKQLNLGMVGCGDIAGYMAMMSRLVRPVRLAACCDANIERAERFARRERIPQMYCDYRELVDDPGVDAVYIAAPHHLHAEMTLAAAAAGKPVLLEKPLARTLDEGRRIVEAVERLGIDVGVNYQYRYDVGCFPLARAVQAGALGKVHSVRINVPWRREPAYFSAAPWHGRIEASGGGTLLTHASHLIDIALWALGEAPVSAVGYTARPGFPDVEVETLAHGILETEGGTLVQVASTMAAAREEAVTIEVYGEQGTAMYRNLPLPRVRFQGVKVRQERPPGWGVHALQRSLAGFARWVLGGEPYLTPARDALPVLAAVEAIYRSSASGKRELIIM